MESLIVWHSTPQATKLASRTRGMDGIKEIQEPGKISKVATKVEHSAGRRESCTTQISGTLLCLSTVFVSNS